MYTPWYHVVLLPIYLEFKFHWNQFTHSYICLGFKFTWYQSGLVYCWLEFKLRWYQATNLPRHQFTKVYWWFLLAGLDPIQSINGDLGNGGHWEPSHLHPPCPDPPFDDSGSSRPCSNIDWYQALSKHGKLETKLHWNQAQLVPRRLETLGPIYQGANVPVSLGTNFAWFQVPLVPIHPCTHLPFTCWYQFIQIYINQVSLVPIYIGFYISMFQLTCESSHQAFNFTGFQVLLVSSLIGTKWTWFAYDLVPIFVGFEVAWFQDHLVSSSLGFKITWFRYGLESKSLGFQFSTHQLRLVMPIDSQR